MNSQEQITRIRVTYAKGPSLRFTGHLDLQRIWERLLRRAKLPLRYSQGYHPRARLNLASALPLGCTSQAELLDFWMNEPLSEADILTRLRAAAPPGLSILSIQPVDLQEKALQTQLTASAFQIAFFEPQDPKELEEKAAALLAQNEIIRTRRKKTYDLRPLILALRVVRTAEDEISLEMKLNAEPNSTGRPDEVMEALGFSNTAYLAQRTCLCLRQDRQPSEIMDQG